MHWKRGVIILSMILSIFAYLIPGFPRAAYARIDAATGKPALSKTPDEKRPQISVSLYLNKVRSLIM